MKHIVYFHYLLEKYKIESFIDLNVKNNFNNYQEFILNIIEVMLEYINTNLLQLMYYDLYDEIYEHIYEIYNVQFENNLLSKLLTIKQQDSHTLLCLSIKLCQNILFKFYIPKRSYKTSFILKQSIINISKIKKKIIYTNIKKKISFSNLKYSFKKINKIDTLIFYFNFFFK